MTSKPSFTLRPVKLPSLGESPFVTVAGLPGGSFLGGFANGEVFRWNSGSSTQIKFSQDSGSGTSAWLIASAMGTGQSVRTVAVSSIFTNAFGDSVIATSTGDNYYLFHNESLAVPLARTKGQVITCAVHSGSLGWLIGTQGGKLLSVSMETVSKREKSFRLMTEISERITDVVSADRVYVSTPTSMFSIDAQSGSATLMFEAPTSWIGSRFAPTGDLAWCSGTAIVSLSGTSATILPHTVTAGLDMDTIVGKSIDKNSVARISPQNVFLTTPYHYVVDLGGKILFVNKVKEGAAVGVIDTAVYGSSLSLVTTCSGGVLLFSHSRMYELVLSDEQSADWKYYLEKRNFLAAARVAVSATQKALVYKSEAEFLLTQNAPDRAADLFAKAVATDPSSMAPYMNDIMSNLDGRNLLKFLLAKIEHIGKDGHDDDGALQVQVSVLFLYAVELFVELLVGEKTNDTDDIENMFYGFISESYSSLNRECIKSVYELLRAHGLFAELVVVAETVGDISTAINTDMALGKFKSVINRFDGTVTDDAILIRVSPILFRYHPNELIDVLIAQKRIFPPTKFLTPVFSFAGALTSEHKLAAMRYLDLWFASESGTHHPGQKELLQVLIELKASEGQETGLVALIEAVHHAVYFDFDFAMRTAVHYSLRRVEIVLLSVRGLHLHAVDKALEIGDIELAKHSAWRPKSGQVRRMAWMNILTHVSSTGDSETRVQSVIDVFHESEVLEILDLLPVLESIGVTSVERVYDEIREALGDMNTQRDTITKEISNFSEALQMIRSDISKRASNHCVVLSHAQKCELCLRLLYNEKFMVYESCGHCFHTECIKEALTLKTVNVKNIDEFVSKFDCVFCGQNSILLEDIFQPFVDPSLDKTEIERWTVRV
jgi:hypothetical protein